MSLTDRGICHWSNQKYWYNQPEKERDLTKIIPIFIFFHYRKTIPFIAHLYLDAKQKRFFNNQCFRDLPCLY